MSAYYGTKVAERWIYSSSELARAISDASQGSVSISQASQAMYDAYQAGGITGIKQLASESGLNVMENFAGYPEWYTIGGMEGTTELSTQVLYREVLDASIDAQTDDVIFETAKQVANHSGSKVFSAGAVKTATSALSFVGAVATGAQLGWESYKEHPDFWTDLSESIFNTSDPNTPVEVLARAHAGGYTTAVREKEIATVLQKLAEQGAFDYQGLETTLTEEGYQEVDFTNVSVQGPVSALALAKVQELYPNDDIVLSCVEYQGTLWDEPVILGTVNTWSTVNLPTHGTVQRDEDSGVYFCRVIAHTTTCVRRISDDMIIRYDNYQHEVDVPSGDFYDQNGNHTAGGLCVVVVDVEATNELFTNDHSPNNLSIAPTDSLSKIIQAIKDKFPAWYDESWLQPEYNPETGTVDNNRYYPVTIPWWNSSEDTNKDPNYTPSTARDGDVYPENDPKAKPQGQELTKNNPRINTDPTTAPTVPVVPPSPTPPDTGGGAGGTSSALWSVYNPTMQELNDLGAYLWTNNIVELLEKFLQNPMDAIISLHKVYCQPDNGPRKNIILGYLDSGVSSLTVANQFKTVDCGTVNVPEYFEDARDYSAPYTVVECYLPFIGVVRLKTEDIIGGKVNIVYTIDLYSGACLCKIFVTKLGAKQLLYNYSGNCSMQIPLTGADRTRLLSGAISGAITGAFMGAEVGAVAGAVAGAWMGGTSIDRTSQFSANAGCMGVKKPYLIITRKYSYDAGMYNVYYGFPSNVTVQLGTCKGFTRVKSVHIENMLRATDNEKNEIETLLKQGVIIN